MSPKYKLKKKTVSSPPVVHRRRLTPPQRDILEDFFRTNRYPTAEEIEQLCESMPEMGGDFIRTWFQNKRFRAKSPSSSTPTSPSRSPLTSPRSNIQSIHKTNSQTPNLSPTTHMQTDSTPTSLVCSPASLMCSPCDETTQQQQQQQQQTISEDEMGLVPALVVAATAGLVDVVEQLLSLGADVNASDTYGRTALHYASMLGNERLVLSLLAAGADVFAKDHSGLCAKDWSVMQHSTVIRDILSAVESMNNTINGGSNSSLADIDPDFDCAAFFV
jgi:hypothetical protein